METSPASGLELDNQTEEQLYRKLVEAREHHRSTGLHLTQEEVEAWLARREAGENAPLPECHLWSDPTLPGEISAACMTS